MATEATGSTVLYTTFWFCVVAVCWGSTNPLLKRGSQGLENIKRDGKIRQAAAELWFLVTRWQYIIPFIINQSGSLLYYMTLGQADISLAVPITNSLTFIFAGISGYLLGEKVGNTDTYFGVACIVAGVSLCVYSKL
eukprot:comp16506_c0_seq1/m.14519 comp16506_c0_seq1/g.14519  ORF comp16506_c0_seq1/g.14519 comp16506_c0_seq1/m.14519 type:complete len:137 (-) comp16506_c0_seq1:334-744(-)